MTGGPPGRDADLPVRVVPSTLVRLGRGVPRLAVAGPQGFVFRGKEPGKRLTRLGRAAVLVGCPLALAVLFVLAAPFTDGGLLAPAVGDLAGSPGLPDPGS